MKQPIIRKDCGLVKVETLTESGEFTGYAAVFGNVDSEGDVIVRGAFGIGPTERDLLIPILYQHDTSRPIGKNLRGKEDDYGLWVRGQLILDTRDGGDTYRLVKGGAMNGLSIGARLQKSSPRSGGGRDLEKLRLMEYSMVTFPANDLARIQAIKADTEKATDFTVSLEEIRTWTMRWQLLDALGYTLSDCMQADAPVSERVQMCDDAIESFRTAYIEWLPKYLALMGDTDDEMVAMAARLEKAGRVLSEKNRKLITDAISMLQGLVDATTETVDASDNTVADLATKSRALELLIAQTHVHAA